MFELVRKGAGIYTLRNDSRKVNTAHRLRLTPIPVLLCAGEIILSTKPHIYVLSTKYLGQFCSSCVSPAPAAGLKRCTQCKNVWYCDAVRPPPCHLAYHDYVEMRYRRVKIMIGHSTRKSVQRCGDGRREPHRRTLLYQQSP
jgi:hypothetical protein